MNASVNLKTSPADKTLILKSVKGSADGLINEHNLITDELKQINHLLWYMCENPHKAPPFPIDGTLLIPIADSVIKKLEMLHVIGNKLWDIAKEVDHE